MTKLLTSKYKSFLVNQLYESIDEGANTAYYLYAGAHVARANSSVPDPKDTNKELIIDAYRNMIFGKRASKDNAAPMIRYIPWESKVFDMYDDQDATLYDVKDYYCVCDEGSNFHVYKCLDNNLDSVSTIQPTYAHVLASDNYTFRTSDGYLWKYMYTATDTQVSMFATDAYFPAYNNSNVAANAVSGAIDVIKIENVGRRYDNHTGGTFNTDQLRVNSNDFLYAVSNSNISFVNGFYTDCLIYISGGPGAGQYRKITDYIVNSNGTYIVIDDRFDTSLENGSIYQITPSVEIRGSGAETINAVARALVNTMNSNSIYRIEMLEVGEGYDYATAAVVANGVITNSLLFDQADLRPLYSPRGGHGVDAVVELGSDALAFSYEFSNTENGTLLVNNQYQQIGLLRDPQFNNVLVEVDDINGVFQADEQVVKVNPLRFNIDVGVSNVSPNVSCFNYTLNAVSVVNVGTTNSYSANDILNINGGTALITGKVIVLTTKVRDVSINNAGSGYGNANTFIGSLGVGSAATNAEFSITSNSTGAAQTIVITNPGSYTVNPPFRTNTAVIGGDGTGLTVSLEMGIDTVRIYDRGLYTTLPQHVSNNLPTTIVGDATGALLSLTFNTQGMCDFVNQLDVDESVYLTNEDGTAHQIAAVDSITNANHLVLVSNGLFSCTQSYMYKPNITANGFVVTSNNTHLMLSNVSGVVNTGDILIGLNSGAHCTVNTISRAGTNKDFNSYIQLYKYNVTPLSGQFVPNETVYQGSSLANSTANAAFFSLANNTYMYTSNQNGQFSLFENVIGAVSGAVAGINIVYEPELVFGSGDVLYIENIQAVERESDQSERWIVVLTF